MASFRREDWQDPAKPVTGPPPKAKRTVGVLHWSGDDSIPSDKKAWLREMQASYLSSRGYSLGYGYLVDAAGNDYEIRGADFNMASNPGDKVSGNANDWTLSVLLDVNLTQQASDAAIATVKRLFANAGIGGRPVPHSFYDYTQCCGAPVTGQINAGKFDPGGSPPPPDQGDEDVLVNLITFKKEIAVWAQYSGGYKIWVPETDVLNILHLCSTVKTVSSFDDDWFLAAGPVLPGTPLPYAVDAWGRKKK